MMPCDWMKKLLLFLVCISCFFAYTANPPIADIIQNNDAAARLLNDSFNESTAKEASLTVLGRNLLVKGNMAIAGLSPLVDNATNGTLAVIIEKGAEMDNFGRLDTDNDGCIESEEQKAAYYNITVEFRLGDTAEIAKPYEKNETIGTKTYADAMENVVNATPTITERAKNASGNESLEVRLNGSITFVYLINDGEKTFDGSCVSNKKIFEAVMDFDDYREVTAAGENKLFFLVKPVLREHWYGDEEISWILLSQRKVYEIEVRTENGSGDSRSVKFQLYNFDVIGNEWGIKQIVSIENDASSVFAGRTATAAAPLNEKNTTFTYLYMINYSGDAGLGKKNLTIKAKDVFFGEEKSNDVVYGRQLSLGEKTETGAPFSWETTRKSFVPAAQESRVVWVLFGAFSIVIILMLIKFRLK